MRKIFSALFVGVLFISKALYAADPPTKDDHPTSFDPPPLFTGSLLTPAGHIVRLGHVNIQPYLYVTNNYSIYEDKHRYVGEIRNTVVNFQLPIKIGLTSWMDIEITPQTISRFKQGVHSTNFGDLSVALQIQLVWDTPENSLPGVMLVMSESFPTGRYQNLNPNKNGTDVGGTGEYATSLGLTGTRTFHIYNEHYLALTSNFTYTFSPPVTINGYNAYGGGIGTHGRVSTGNTFVYYLGLQYTTTVHWALAFDLMYQNSQPVTFSGAPGTTDTGEVANNENGSTEQWSIAPAIEYNWNEHYGLIVGAWGTIAGRNASAFISGVASLNMYF